MDEAGNTAMTSHPDKVVSVANKITSMAEEALSGLDLVIAQWPPEYSAIVWGAVADIASRRAHTAHMKAQKTDA